MPIRAEKLAEEVLYKQFQYRVASPLEHQLQCLDVLTKVEQTLLQKVVTKMSCRLRPLVRQGSMLDVMADESKWRSADSNILDCLRKGLVDLKNPLTEKPSDEIFQKNSDMSRIKLSFSADKGFTLWLCGVAGIDLGNDESLSCTVDGLTASFVDFVTIRDWISGGDWCPNIQLLKFSSDDWSKDHRSKIKKLWIVTEVLYATKFTVTGRKGLFDSVMAQANWGGPGLGLNAGAEIAVRRANATTLELKANRHKHFIVGYRTMRVEYNLDGTVRALRAPEDTGLRGDDDDPHQTNLVSMEEDIFEVDEESGDKVPVPLLTPTQQELNDLKLLAATDFRASKDSLST